ncbi:MAG: hypothetical protein EAZ74_03265 [Alphaproteobacteria bacterium]|nr:MAG: hypothetical protein EAZ74_03265 [Alphaproteobacteria bacterium]TAF39070.1 MAG: hypothetical protein EAZ66_05335 [Alphaproteobacteria bacterium]
MTHDNVSNPSNDENENVVPQVRMIVRPLNAADIIGMIMAGFSPEQIEAFVASGAQVIEISVEPQDSDSTL